MSAEPKKLLRFLVEEAKGFQDLEISLYNIFMNRSTSYGNGALEHELEEDEDATKASYRSKIELIYQGITTLHEILQLNIRREFIVNEVEAIRKSDGGIFSVEFLPHLDVVSCPSLEVIDRELDLLTALLGAGKTKKRDDEDVATASNTLYKLLGYLERTGFYVSHLLESAPTSESDINKIMDVLLGGSFAGDYVRKPHVSQVIKNFKPDGGLKSIGAAIEYKFIASKEELPVALEGIYADMKGYSGSKDWTQFVTVFYMTDHFAPKETVEKDIREKSDGKWLAIVLSGNGARANTKKRATSLKKSMRSKA